MRAMPAVNRGKVSSRWALLLPIGYQASPIRAARRIEGPLSPPTQIGGWGFCSGLGSVSSPSMHILAVEHRPVLRPDHPHRVHVLIRDGTAFGKRCGRDGIELHL